MQDDTVLDIESRQYINPQTNLNERMAFIDTLRDVQAQNTAEINQNTYNLGSQVPSNVGGLTGSEGLWQAQYQTPQVDAQVADLKAVAQQQALNQITSNLQDVYQNRYKQALRNFYARRKAENDRNKNPLNPLNTDDNVKEKDPTSVGTATGELGQEFKPGENMVVTADSANIEIYDPVTKQLKERRRPDGYTEIYENGQYKGLVRTDGGSSPFVLSSGLPALKGINIGDKVNITPGTGVLPFLNLNFTKGQ